MPTSSYFTSERRNYRVRESYSVRLARSFGLGGCFWGKRAKHVFLCFRGSRGNFKFGWLRKKGSRSRSCEPRLGSRRENSCSCAAQAWHNSSGSPVLVLMLCRRARWGPASCCQLQGRSGSETACASSFFDRQQYHRCGKCAPGPHVESGIRPATFEQSVCENQG